MYFDKEKIPTSDDTLATLGITSQGTKSGFDAAATTAEGVFEMEDDYGTSYYYRGVSFTVNASFFCGHLNVGALDVVLEFHTPVLAVAP